MSSKKNHITPPRLAEKLLLWFLKDELAEEVLGDLDEKFYSTAEKHSIRKAKRNYWYQVINYLRPFAFRFFKFKNSNTTAMFKHNLLISYRSFLRFKGNFFINLIGLSSGLACTLLIYLWVNYEMSFDSFHENSDRIYQVMQNLDENGEVITITPMPGRLAEELMANYPEVESATMVWPPNFFGPENYVSYQNQQFKVLAQFVDREFLDIMSFPLIAGNPGTVLQNKSEVLISESLARKIFGSTDNLIGKTINWDEGKASGDYLVGGIFKDVPQNSTMQFDMLLNAEIMMEAYAYMEDWGNSNPSAFVFLKDGTSSTAFNTKIEKLIQTKVKSSTSTLFIQKFSDRYLKGSYANGKIAGGRIVYVRLFSIVALITLAIACINFMNLSTAKATTRIKEIGVKKALGARRKTLIGQYYIESFLLTILGTLVALFIAVLVLPKFGEITGKSLSINFSLDLIIGILCIILVTGTLAGSYPALYLSKFRTTESLKGKLTHGFKDIWARKGLVIVQFMVSIVLIVCVMVVSKQVEYIQSANLGYQKDNVLYFANTGLKSEGYEAFLSKVESIPGVLNVTTTAHDLTGDNGQTSGLSWPGKNPDENINFMNLEMGANFIETVGIELMEGRTFDSKLGNITDQIIFNEKAIKMMGLEDPIGQTIKLWGQEKKIIGVVKDFRAQSLYSEIQPAFLRAYPMGSKTMVKIQSGTEQQTLAQLRSVFEEFNPGFPFEYKFLDNDYQAMYQSEKRVAALSKLFSVIAILITCLGLLGLTAFTTERRSKEIGIRKVLGSESWRIVLLLTTDFTKMVLLALTVALPIGYMISNQWLSNFAEGIELNGWYFLITALFTLLITWLTSGSLTITAAIRNPVKSLRSE